MLPDIAEINHALLCFCVCLSCLPFALHEWRKMQRSGQMPVPAKLYWKILPNGKSKRSTGATYSRKRAEDTRPLNAHVTSHLQHWTKPG